MSSSEMKKAVDEVGAFVRAVSQDSDLPGSIIYRVALDLAELLRKEHLRREELVAGLESAVAAIKSDHSPGQPGHLAASLLKATLVKLR